MEIRYPNSIMFSAYCDFPVVSGQPELTLRASVSI